MSVPGMLRPRRRHRLGSSMMALGLALGAVGAHPATAQDAVATYDIEGRTLADALRDFARVSGAQIIFTEELLDGRPAPSLRGDFTAAEALDVLLAGSGLRAERTPSGAIMIVDDRRAQAEPAPERPGDATPASTAPRRRLAVDAAPTRATETIVVTGTRIVGAPPAAPLLVVERAEIDNSGYSQVGDLMRAIPQNFPGGFNPEVLPNPTAGSANLSNASTVNLRGLGPGATLVLFNGHRLAADGQGPAPDISAIPLAAIERVEIVTDGASSLYGSDAVAGVVNFIMRSDFDGLEASARVGGATRGGGLEQTYNLTAGRTWRSGHLLGGAEHLEQDPILASERDFTANAGPLNTLLSGQERASGFLSGRQDLGESATLTFDGLYMDRSADQTTEWTPGGPTDAVDVSATSFLLAPGLDLDLPGGWGVTLDGSLGRGAATRVTVSTPGSRFVSDTRNEAKTIEAVADGTLFSLPSGDVRLAAGGGYREESQRLWTTTAAERRGERDISYVFGELLVPFVEASPARTGLNELDLSIAARYENYSDFGPTTNPRVGLRYVPLDGLTVRGTWGESFKAPIFDQMNVPPVLLLFNAATLGSSEPGTALYFFGGNPDLGPERSTSWTVGLDWVPSAIDGFDVSVTYFNIAYTDRAVVPLLSLGTALSNPAHEAFLIRNPSADVQTAFFDAAARFVNASGAPYDPATVVAIANNAYVNASAQDVDGVDLSVRKSFDVAGGSLDAFLNATWMTLSQQTIPTVPTVDLSGTIFYPVENRFRGGVTWTAGELSSTVTVNHVSGLTDNIVTPAASIDPWTTLDLSARYRLPAWSARTPGLEMGLSVINATDEAPPFAAGAEAGGIAGIQYDSTNASAIGRFVAVTVRQRF